MVGWMECLPFRDLSQIGTSFTRRARYTIHGKGSVVASPPLQINTRTLAATQIAYQYGTRFGRSNSAIDFTQED
jgi:hypothetical protein